MIFISDNNWLSNTVSFGVLIVAGLIAFLATSRRGWKAWPLLLCSALLVPVLAIAATVVALNYIDRIFGLAGGFVVHANWLILIVLVPTIIGAIIGSASRQRSVNGS